MDDQTIIGNPEIAFDTPPPPVDPNEGTWETPARKYYGRKLPDGKLEKEKPYIHQDYPSARYAQPGAPGTQIVQKMVASKEDEAKLGEGWEHSPSAFGYLSAPSQEELARLQKNPAQILIDAQAEKDAYARSEAAAQAKAEAQEAAAKELAEQRAADEAALEKRIADAVAAALSKRDDYSAETKTLGLPKK